MLRARLAELMAKFGFDPAGHAGKALAHALTALPHDLLIAFDGESLERLALTSMSITDRPRPKLVTVKSALGRHLFVFVWQIGRAHVCTPVTNAHLVCRLLLEKN